MYMCVQSYFPEDGLCYSIDIYGYSRQQLKCCVFCELSYNTLYQENIMLTVTKYANVQQNCIALQLWSCEQTGQLLIVASYCVWLVIKCDQLFKVVGK